MRPSMIPTSLCGEMAIWFYGVLSDLCVGKGPGCSPSVNGAVLRRSIT